MSLLEKIQEKVHENPQKLIRSMLILAGILGLLITLLFGYKMYKKRQSGAEEVSVPKDVQMELEAREREELERKWQEKAAAVIRPQEDILMRSTVTSIIVPPALSKQEIPESLKNMAWKQFTMSYQISHTQFLKSWSGVKRSSAIAPVRALKYTQPPAIVPGKNELKGPKSPKRPAGIKPTYVTLD